MPWATPVIVCLGAVTIIVLGRWIAAATSSARNPVIALNLRYQPLALAVAVIAVIAVDVLVPDHEDFLAVGDWSAPASAMGWLGVADGDPWTSVGITFLIVMTVVTGAAVWLQIGRGSSVTVAGLVRALPIAVAFSAVNAVTEELLFRLTLAQGLSLVLGASAIAGLAALLFGGPHWFGHPGRLIGVILAGFMGWFLTLSVLQTGGLGWALVIHGAQDVVILTTMVAVAGGRSAPQRQPWTSSRAVGGKSG